MTGSQNSQNEWDSWPQKLPDLVAERVKPYDDLDVLRQFAMFMGKAQVLELTLKNVLARRFGNDHDDMERWTLGRVKKEMAESNVRPDFIAFLGSLVELRNFIAHDFLASEALLLEAVGRSGRLNLKHLHKAIWEVEQLLLVVEWQEKYDAWM